MASEKEKKAQEKDVKTPDKPKGKDGKSDKLKDTDGKTSDKKSVPKKQ